MDNKIMMKIAPNSIKLGKIPFTLYGKNERNEMVLFCRSGMAITDEHIKILSRANKTFYITSSEMDNYLDYTFNSIEKIIKQKDVQVEEKAQILHAVSRKIVCDLIKDPRSGKAVERSKVFIKSTIDLIITAPEVSALMLQIKEEENYLFSHCINTCIFSLMIAKQIFHENQKELFKIGMGGILLDSGMTQVDKNLLNKSGPLTDDEKKEVMKHPSLGAKIAEEHNLAPEIITMIKNHHERLDGSGYTQGLKGNELDLFSRIAAVADVYNALTSMRSYRNAYPHLSAVKIMVEHKDKFDREIMDCLFRIIFPSEDLVSSFSSAIRK
jgi:HD-GYP domain-containing protein (c-di-GMP phosphodiesterase class II)